MVKKVVKKEVVKEEKKQHRLVADRNIKKMLLDGWKVVKQEGDLTLMEK